MKQNMFTSLLSSESGSLSSKRLAGLLGWLTCSAVLLMCTIWEREAPQMVDVVLYTSTALLGVDSVTGIWKSEKKGNETD